MITQTNFELSKRRIRAHLQKRTLANKIANFEL